MAVFVFVVVVVVVVAAVVVAAAVVVVVLFWSADGEVVEDRYEAMVDFPELRSPVFGARGGCISARANPDPVMSLHPERKRLTDRG
jgi:hypothetical protein